MAIYRGVGGSGDANNDAIVSDVAEYSLAAQTAATNAANSATSASSSATSASGSASAASTSATNAASSASSASTSATNAANGATSAASSATSANSSKNAAALSETNAANSASAAATSEANAATSEANAASSETNAASSASAASTSATNAASSASSASTSATNASNSASSAATSASSAALSASNAATSETNAALSETNAASSEANALASETAAAASESATAALYDNFDDRYLGVKTTDPTLDNDGDALVTGALYFNSSTGVMMVYNGTGWQSLASGSASVTSFNGRTGTVILTSTDVTDALTYTPLAPSAIGTTVQAYDADLTAFAAKTAPTGGVVGTTDTQTLTNKTISGSSNTLSNIGNSSLTNSSLTIGSTNISLGDTSTTLAGLTGVTVEANTSTDALRITQTGTGNALVVEDSPNPDSSPFVIDTNGKVIAGNTASTAMLGTGQPVIQVVSATGAVGSSTLGIGRWAAATSAPELWLSKSRGTSVGANTIVNSGDNLGRFRFSGDDGSAFIEAASIDAQVDGIPGTNDMPGRLVFSTTADGASSPTERMRIDSAGQMNIGSVGTTAGYTLFISRNPTGATTSYGIAPRGTIQSDVTANYFGIRSWPSVAAASFTLNNLYHYSCTQGTIGAGATVSNQFGYSAESSLTGATNNYGFYSNIPSGTGRWNFYAAGTADNYFGGATTINVNSSSDALRITQTGAGNALVVEDSANPDSTSFVIAGTGDVGIGTSSPGNKLDVNGSVNLGMDVYLTRGSPGPFLGTSQAQPIRFGTGGAEQMRLDSSGNLGLGVTPSAWVSTWRAFDLGAGASLFSNGVANFAISANAYNTDGGGGWKYKGTGNANLIQAAGGQFIWYNAPSGTAGSAISFTQAMTLDASGNLLVGATSNASAYRAQFTGTGSGVVGVRSSGSYSGIEFADSGTSSTPAIYSNGNAITAWTSGSERMRIDSSGTVILASTSGLTIGRTAVTAPVSSDGNVFSGTYTPTLTNTTNIAASTAYPSQYMRVGATVTVSGQVDIDPTSANADTVLELSLPIASNFAQGYQCGGTFVERSAQIDVYGCISSNVTSDTAQFRFYPVDLSTRSYMFTFTYRVI